MIRKYQFVLLTILIFVSGTLQARDKVPEFPVLKGLYLGQKPPGMTPEVFAPGIISIVGNKYREYIVSFWPDGNRCIFTRFGDGIPDFTVFESTVKNGVWTKPDIAEVLKNYGGYLPCVSCDGNKIFFTPAQSAENYPHHLWYIENRQGKWSQPKHICEGMYPSVTLDGTLYYDKGGHIVRRRFINGVYQEMEIICPAIYSQYEDAHPFIAPDESYLIFDSSTRPGIENNELLISFRTGDNSWTKPQKMAEILNLKPTGMARVTYDGKYLFFTSRGDVYWVDAEVIEKLKLNSFRNKACNTLIIRTNRSRI